MAERGELAQGHGVRFEEVIVRQIVALADRSGVTYSEMTRTLIDEALLARLARPGLGRATLREAVLHAIEYQPEPQLGPTARDEIAEMDMEAEYIAMMQEQGEWD